MMNIENNEVGGKNIQNESLKNEKIIWKNDKEEKINLAKGKAGITLIALIVTIIVLLLLVGITISSITGENGIFSNAKKAKNETIIGQEKEHVELAYVSAAINKLGDNVTADELQDELDKSVGENKTKTTINDDYTLNVLFNDTEHNFNVNNGVVTKVEIDNTTMAMFDTGTNVAVKMRKLASEGNFGNYTNLSIDAIKRYTGTPDLSTMTDDNIVSWIDGYSAYEQNPSSYSNIVPEDTKLCKIYMWYEQDDGTEMRDFIGKNNDFFGKEVNHGTIYWWSESKNIYLNADSSNMFAFLPFLSDIRGVMNFKTDYVTNMSNMFAGFASESNFTNVDSLARWNTSSVTNMSGLFAGKITLTDINGIKKWNTSNVTNMSKLLYGCQGITNIEALSNWDTSKVTNMSAMFSGDGDFGGGVVSVEDFNAISNWYVSNVTDMSYMFGSSDSMTCSSSIKSLNSLANWDVSKVTTMQGMFNQCTNLVEASGINDWNISNVSNFDNMFKNANTHPEFTKVPGTWDENGTFTPNK